MIDPMPARAKKSAALRTKSAAKKSPATKARSDGGLGRLPEWNLADLYAGIDDPKVKRDLDRADEYAKAFEDDYKGKLAALAEADVAALAQAAAEADEEIDEEADAE